MTSRKLTICIPSFNRSETAKNCASILLKQINNSDINVLIIDNGSEKNYKEEFSQVDHFSQAIADGTLSIVRNPYNIGMSANFMRCFEVAKGDWLWMVSDDDDIKPDAVESILDAIEDLSDVCGFIAFGGEVDQPLNSISYLKNLEDFIDFNCASIDIFNTFIFITNGVYDLKRFRPLLAIGYQYLNTFIPHFMMQIAYMQQGNMTAVVPRKVVDYVVPAIGYSYSMVAGLGVGAPKHALIKTDAEHYAKYLSLFFPHNDYKVIIDLYYICKRDAYPFVFRHLANNYLHYVSDARGFLQVLMLRVFLLLVRVPVLFERLIVLGERVSPKFKAHVSEIKKRYR